MAGFSALKIFLLDIVCCTNLWGGWLSSHLLFMEKLNLRSRIDAAYSSHKAPIQERRHKLVPWLAQLDRLGENEHWWCFYPHHHHCCRVKAQLTGYLSIRMHLLVEYIWIEINRRATGFGCLADLIQIRLDWRWVGETPFTRKPRAF